MNKPDIGILRAIGQPLRRKEDQRLLTGQGRFSDDFNLPGQVYAAAVRSPHPHARIVRVDADQARRMPGVLGIFTGVDAAAAGLKPLPHEPVPATKFDMKLTSPKGGKVFIGRHVLLPVDRVRHVGEAVVMVVAETKAAAMDAAEVVLVDYENLPWVADAALAGEPDAPSVWDDAPGNVLVDTRFGDTAAVERAFAVADHVVNLDVHVGRVTAVPLEPRAALADYDTTSGKFTLYAGSGGAVKQKRELAGVLGIDPELLRVLSFDVGGNYGARNRPYVEFGLVLWASRQIGRPVKYTATRSEAFLTDYQGRDLIVRAALALRQDGRFLAMRTDNISNVGSHCVSLSPLGKGAGLITGSYDIPVATLRARAVFTNTMPTNAYRSSGRPEVTYAIERLVDLAAAKLGMDRIEIRRRNLVSPLAMPYTNAVGSLYDSGEYESNMDAAMRLADIAGFETRRREAVARGKLLGLGLANYVESSIGAPRERAEVTVLPEQRIDVVIGTQPSGQGHETSFSQVIADLLHVPVETVNIIMGDTDIVAVGGGTHSGRSMRHAATVFAKATTDLIAKGKQIAALALYTTADQVEFADGRFSAPRTNRSFDVFELAREIGRLQMPDALRDGLAVVTDNEMHEPVFPNGCATCELEVDPETGQVEIVRYAAIDDVGRCINPLIVHGQTHGGIAQGVGQAMWEMCAIDAVSGQPLCGSFQDYALPRADTLPSFKTKIVEVLSPTNPLGIKAGGEGGTTPALAVIVSGVLDALKDYGVRDIKMPATPFTVWRAIQDAKSREGIK